MESESASPTGSRWRGLGLWALLLAVAVGGFTLQRWLSPAAVSAEAPDARPLVAVASYQREQGPLQLARLGRVQARHETRLAAEISGRVMAVHPQLRLAGQVAAGAELLQLDTRPLEIRQAELRAERRARAAEEEQLALRLRRLEDLARRDFVAGDQLDELRARRTAAAAAVERIDAQLDGVQLDLERSVIRAPYRAHVLEVAAAPGDIAQPGGLLARLVSAEEQEVQVDLGRNEWPLIERAWRRGSLTATAVTAAGTSLALAEPRLGGSVDPGSRSVSLVFSAVPAMTAGIVGDAALSVAESGTVAVRPGETVTATLSLDPEQSWYRLPRETLQRRPGRVWRLLDDDTLAAAEVRPLLFSGADVFVTSEDLGSAGRLLLSDLPSITPGMAVRVREQATAGSTTP